MRLFWLILMIVALGTATAAAQVGATTQQATRGPDVVVLNGLAHLYQPVPFDHKSHAQMAEMGGGCTSCHHRNPTTQQSDATLTSHTDQAQAAKFPACKNCHEINAEQADIRMPTLKGAYHRQCMNCHREWADQKSCSVCHEAKGGTVATTLPVTPDDIIGRMHPPLAEPTVKVYSMRITPAVGAKVMFRHDEHVKKFGLKCANCHEHDTCRQCHSEQSSPATQTVLKVGRTWEASHGPCIGCHKDDRCKTCHYDEKASAPPAFEHRMVGQLLDKDHSSLKCGQCHQLLKSKKTPTCGDAKCHKPELAIAYPAKKPGPVVVAAAPATAPSTRPTVEIRTDATGTIVKRVRPAPTSAPR